MYFLSRNKDEIEFSSFEEEISRRAKNGDTKSYLYIVPTGAQARELINWVTELSSPRAITLPSIISLDDLISRFARYIRPDVRILSDAETAVFVELALKDLLKQNALRYFEGSSNTGAKLPIPRGTFERLVAGIAGLRENGISPENLEEDIKKAESGSERLIADRSALRRAHDLAAIYKAYEGRLGTEFTDKSGQVSIIADHFELPSDIISEGQRKKIEKIFGTLFRGVTDIFIGSFIRLSEPAQQILFAFSEIENVRLTFGIDYEKNNEPLFALQERFFRRASDEGFALVKGDRQQSVTLPEVQGFQNILRNSLFNYSKGIPPASTVRIHSHAADTMKDEIRFAAKRIKELIGNAKEPLELSRICVASYRQDQYAPLAAEIFREYGIPANITDRARLDRSPLYLAFNALFDLAELNFNRRSLLRLLSSPYLIISGTGGNRVDAVNLYEVIAEYRLHNGSESWLEEMDVYHEQVNEALEGAADDFEEREMELKLRKLTQARKDMAVVEKLIDRLKGKKTPAEFHKTMHAIIGECRVVSQLLASSGPMINADALEFDTRSYRAFSSLLEELVDICSQLDLENSSLPLSFYTERIRIAALRTRFAPRAEPGRGVIVTSFEQTIGYEFDHLFLIGLNDGIFPEVYSQTLFNLKEHQPSEDDALIEQRYLFYQTLCTFRKEAYIVWHSGADDKKSEIMRSQFADALEEIVPFIEMPSDKQERQIYSTNEFFRYAGTRKNIIDSNTVLAKEKGLDDHSLEILKSQIPHSVLVEEKRISSPETKYSGVLPLGELSEAEREDLLSFRNRIYSISQLETYAACPFKFFAKYILHLETGMQTNAEEGLSGSEKGIVLHETLFHILSSLRESGQDIRSLSDEDFRRISGEIIVAKQKEISPAKNHPFWRLDKESVFEPPEPGIGMLQKFIDAERRFSSFITKPSFFEATFGLRAAEEKRDKMLYSEDHVEVSGIKFRGKIDRIDMDATAGIFTVTDYKSGKSATKKDIDRGLSLQLPLYLRVAEDLLRAHLGDEQMSGVAGMYHTLLGKESKQHLAIGLHEFAGKAFEGRKGGGKPLSSEVESAEELSQLIEATIEFAKNYVEGIIQGSFPLVKEENIAVCTYCEYKQVCRVGEALENGALRA